MLVQLGHRAGSAELVELLLECHGRIRSFLALAARLGTAAEVSVAETAEVAGQLRRYFATAFPLHVADEEHTLLPALADRPEAAGVLARMVVEHHEHAPLVARLIAACEALERAPAQPRDAVVSAAAVLAAAIEPHLALEERELFPVIRALPAELRDQLVAAMRGRRVT